ncbi:MAG: SCP2 sterol-binding domain-containing protein [Eubacteriales bacterium]|nr:SCP2 sterol-binding domain-containing protein [Eubacteriales bacterium]
MNVNIYYGGRGLIEDPTIYVMNKITEVLEELNVSVHRYNLYEDKRNISVLPKTLKEADAVILAASVEWLGIGGLLQQFLDACWLYGDQEVLQTLYMMPVVLSTTYGEQDSNIYLKKAWDLLGGLPCDGLCAYVENHVDFETNPAYAAFIEKRVETFYRTFTKKMCILPSSDNAVQETISRSSLISLTPQESEQLSMYVSDETYVKTQKADIQELSEMFRKELGVETGASPADDYTEQLQKHFHSIADISLAYALQITDQDRTLYLFIDDGSLTCTYEKPEHNNINVVIRLKQSDLDAIIAGELTMQKAFMNGDVTAKGDFKILRNFDNLFQF